jgi:hypothetical protein
MAWALLMLSFAIGKISRFGIVSYVSHFTNWSWTFQIVFYLATALAPFLTTGLLDPHSTLGSFTRSVIVLGFWPLNGIIFTVMYGVSYLLGTGSHFLSNIFTKYPPEIVFIGNDLVHFWPIVVLLLFFIVYSKLIAYSLNDVLVRYGALRSPLRFTAFIGYQTYVGASVAIAVYALLFDPRVVYETDQTLAEGALVALVALTIATLVPLLFFLWLGVASPARYSREWLARNIYDARLDGGGSRSQRLDKLY